MKNDKKDLAIAYGIQRRNKKKKMAEGGIVTPARKEDDKRFPESEYMGENWSYGSPPARKPDDKRLPEDDYMSDKFAPRARMAQGGMVEAIMKKRGQSKASDDGEFIDLNDTNAENLDNDYDDMNEEAGMKELYDDSQMSDQPEDSNEMGDDIDADEHDMIAAIRRKMKSTRG